MDQDRADTAQHVETHRVIKGRRWRVSDPDIPEHLRQALVNELMNARRAVRDAPDATAERRARARVHDAKVALGERGLAWWSEHQDPADIADRITRAHRAASRTPGLDGPDLLEAVAAITSQPGDVVSAVLADAEAPVEEP